MRGVPKVFSRTNMNWRVIYRSGFQEPANISNQRSHIQWNHPKRRIYTLQQPCNKYTNSLSRLPMCLHHPVTVKAHDVNPSFQLSRHSKEAIAQAATKESRKSVPGSIAGSRVSYTSSQKFRCKSKCPNWSGNEISCS